MEGILLEPLQYYEKVGKTAHEQNVSAHFNELLNQSGVDVAENRATVKKYKAEKATAQKITSRVADFGDYRVFYRGGCRGGKNREKPFAWRTFAWRRNVAWHRWDFADF